MRNEMLMEEEILELFAGLSREAARCELHALRAIKDNRPEMVPLFKSLGLSLTMQAKRFMMQIRGMVTNTEKTIKEVYQSILPASIEDYEELTRKAEQLGSKALVSGFDQSARIQRKNTSLYRQVAKDRRTSTYHVCNFCGFVSRDSKPEKCPVCTAPDKRFILVTT